MKVCITCNIEKNFSEFFKRKDSKDGLRNDCKICHKNSTLESTKRYYAKQSTKEKSKKLNKIYWENNKEELSIENRARYYKNREKYLLSKKIYYQKNKEQLVQNVVSRNIQKIKTDPLFKFKHNVRSLLRKSIVGKGYKKNTKTELILGINLNEFLIYIERKFEPWMSWDNYGMYNGEFDYGWDLDHIIPMSSANSETEVLALSKFSNLQPLCSKVNRDIKKSLLNF